MWWSEARPGCLRRRARRLALPLAALALAGCGFQPLYGPRSVSTTADQLAAVKVELIEDRLGQQVRNNLLDRMSPRGEPEAPRYTLAVALSENLQELGFRKDETATRANLVVTASYALTKVGEEQPLLKGKSQSANSFNIVDSDYATLIAENDARTRAARRLSDEISTRLAIFFNGRGNGS